LIHLTVLHMHSYPIITIIITITTILSLGSTNQWQHMTFGHFCLAYLAQCYDLQLHPLSCKRHNFVFLYDCVISHGYTHTHTQTHTHAHTHFLYPLISCWAPQLSP
jgi:hypothetical protein